MAKLKRTDWLVMRYYFASGIREREAVFPHGDDIQSLSTIRPGEYVGMLFPKRFYPTTNDLPECCREIAIWTAAQLRDEA